jgi:hypothetical protein
MDISPRQRNAGPQSNSKFEIAEFAYAKTEIAADREHRRRLDS